MKKTLFIVIIITGLFGFVKAQTPNWLWAETETTGSCYMEGRGISASPVTGDIYVDGRFGGTMTLGGKSAVASGTEIFSARLNNAGTASWITPHPYSGGNDYSYGFGRDNKDNTYTTGTINSGSGGFFVDKTNSAGVIKWKTIIPGTSGYGNIAVDNLGYVYVTGNFSGSVNFGPTILNATSGCIFLAKFDSNGVCVWAKNAGSNGATDGGRGVVVDNSGGVYVCGAYNGTATFGTLVTPPANAGYPSFFIAKYDSSGVPQWVQTATNAGFGTSFQFWNYNGITIDSCANVYVTGHFISTAIFGPFSVTSAGAEDIFVAKCRSNGNWEWVQSNGGTGSDEGMGIAVDKYSDVYVTGYFVGTANFGSTSVSTTAGSSIFVSKYANSTGAFQWVQSAVGAVATGGSWISVDKQGFVYIAGSVGSGSGTTAFGSSNVSNVSGCGQNVLLAKLDTIPLRSITPHPDTTYCAGSTVTLPYTITGTFNAGNVFTAQLSDNTGSFSTPVNIGNTTSTTGGTITITIPSGTTPGTTYLIRVISSNPATSSWANGCGTYFVNNVYVDNFYITIVAPPTVTTSGNPSICKGDSTVISASGGVTYSWNTGSTSSNITVKPVSTTTYSVSVSNGTCSKDTTVTVTVNPLPSVTFTGTNSICKGDSTTITASGGTTYTWNTGATTSSILVKPSSNTTYSVSVGNGTCKKDSTFSVTVNPLPVVTLSGTTTVCAGTPTTLTASGGTSYTWNTGATTSSISVSPTSNTTYSVNVGNGSCTKDTTISVTVNPLPVVTLSGTTTICTGSSTTLTANGGTSYTWNTGATTSSISVTPAGTTTYSVSVSNGTCIKDTTVTVTVNPLPTIILSGNTGICSGDSTTITASGGTTYVWSTGATTSSVTLKPASTTTYTVQVNNGCTKDTSITITVNPKPISTISADQTICAGASVSITANGGTTYSWSSGETTSAINVTPAVTTTYSVTVSNGGCSVMDSSKVTVNPMPVATAGGSTTITSGQSTPLVVTPGYIYKWIPSAGLNCDTCTNPVASPTVTTWYYVTITDSAGCSIKDSVLIIVKEKCGPIYVPTGFSPNGDGWNDVLNVMGNCIKEMDLVIYDRWGNKLFETTDPAVGWDGTYKGQPMNPGTYVFLLNATDIDGNLTVKKGNITLVR